MARFSKQQLYRLRNEIPIDHLIANVLQMPVRTTDGRLRFRCPLCNAFNTAVKAETNLARCFICEKNFNTIDLVMLIKNLDFVAGVDFLKHCLNKHQRPCQPNTNRGHRDDVPAHIGEILSSIVAKAPEPIDATQSICNRITALEKKVEHLIRRLSEIDNLIK